MFSDSDLLPISALQHLLYCERQCALIHTERLWAENRFTVEGRHLHERADSGKREARPGRKTQRAVPLWSYELGLFGKADVIEFRASQETGGHGDTGTRGTHGEIQAGSAGLPASAGVPFPLEYKRGKPKAHDADRVQLCAQAMCLEEMLDVAVPAGALFYGRTRRRQEVAFDAALRALTRQAAGRLHEMLASGLTPAAVYEKRKCGRCSLASQCLPRVSAGRASGFVDRQVRELLAAAGPASE
jgi:CRISPR-associated exonuclease Cas4